MTTAQHIFTTTRFECGCIYRTISDTAVFCPEHRRPITEEETINIPSPDTPDIPGLVMNGRSPAILWNTGNNSLHTTTALLDGDSNEWADPNDELVGICPACFIDKEEYLETGIAMCECGDQKCSYRWCGSTQGLHAFWRLHAEGRSQETTGRHDTDIFSYGKYETQSPEIRAVLDQERTALEKQAQESLRNMVETRQDEEQQSTGQNPYLAPWLDRDYEMMTSASGSSTTQEWARARLTGKLTRLHVIGALPPREAPAPGQ